MTKKSLLELQSNLSQAIQHGLHAPLPLSELHIKNQPPLSCKERLFIYQNAYRLRIIDSIVEDYPQVSDFLGENEFEHLVSSFIRKTPSRSWSLGEYSKEFLEFLGSTKAVQKYPFLADLAQMEWCENVSFLAAQEEVFDFPQFLSSIPENEVQNVVLQLSGSVFLFQSQWDFGVFKKKKKALPKESFYLIYKKEGRVQRETLNVNQFKILENIKMGLSIEQLGAAIDNVTEAEMTQWILEWVTMGVLAGAINEKERTP